MAANMKMTVFWDMLPCSLVEADRRYRSAYASPKSLLLRQRIPEDCHLHGLSFESSHCQTFELYSHDSTVRCFGTNRLCYCLQHDCIAVFNLPHSECHECRRLQTKKGEGLFPSLGKFL